MICDDFPVLRAPGSITTEILRCQENFACVRIFYCGSRRKGPAFATSVAFISMAIANQTTIARSDRFTRTVSYQPFAVRALGFKMINSQTCHLFMLVQSF